MRLAARNSICMVTIIGLFTTTGCVERSVVVRVKKDGSGVVHLRHHARQTTISFGVLSEEDDVEESSMPSEELLGELTEALGEGVKLVSATKSTNRSGWPGFEVIWRFDDINQMTLPDSILATDEDDEVEAGEAADAGAAEDRGNQIADTGESGFRFALSDDRLEIFPYGKDAEATPAATENVGAVDPFADEPRGGPNISFGDIAAQTVLTKALADMRFGMFVEVDGEIHDSNAKHRDGNLLTLISIDVGKVLEDPQAKQRLEKLGGRKASREEFQQLADCIEGLMVDLQDLIYVSFR